VLFFFLFPKEKIVWTGETKQTWERFKTLSSFNLWAFTASIFAILSDRLEIFLLKKFHNPEQVAIYGTSLQLFSGFQIVFSTLNSMILPRLSGLVNDTVEFNRFLKKSFTICAGIALVLVPGFFLAEPILNLLFNNKYSDSIPVFRILYPNYLLQLVFAPLGIALFAMGRPKILAILALIRLLIGFVFDNLLIPEYGVMGAGVSFFLGQVVSWLILAGFFWATIWR
jgi:O-antigen/teichoic acid export membrane protein